MPRFGRRSNSEPWTPWKLTIPASLAGTVEFLLLDPTLGKPTYGSRNTLVVRLLEAWLKTLPTEVKQVQGGALPLLRELNQ